MNRIELINQSGWSFAYQGGLSVYVKDSFGISKGEASSIYLNDLTTDEMRRLEAADQLEREELITQFLENRFLTLGRDCATGGQKKTFQLQCYQNQTELFVVFEQYGLAGGGVKKFLVAAGGIAKVGVGLLAAGAAAGSGGLFAPLVIASGAGGLVSSGIGDIAYAVKTPEERIEPTSYMKQSSIGFAAGAVGGGAGMVVGAVTAPLGSLVGTAVSGAASTVSSTAAATITEAAIANDSKILRRLTPKELAKAATVGVLTVGVSTLSKDAVDQGSQLVLGSRSGIASTTAIGATAGAASGTAVKITENVINQFDYLKVTYTEAPNPYQIEPGKLYVFAIRNVIYFQSLNHEGRMLLTPIDGQAQLGTIIQQETRFDRLIEVLNSRGMASLSSEQKQFILANASRHGHRPAGIFDGVNDAATVGMISGAVTGLTQEISRQSKMEPQRKRRFVKREFKPKDEKVASVAAKKVKTEDKPARSEENVRRSGTSYTKSDTEPAFQTGKRSRETESTVEADVKRKKIEVMKPDRDTVKTAPKQVCMASKVKTEDKPARSGENVRRSGTSYTKSDTEPAFQTGKRSRETESTVEADVKRKKIEVLKPDRDTVKTDPTAKDKRGEGMTLRSRTVSKIKKEDLDRTASQEADAPPSPSAKRRGAEAGDLKRRQIEERDSALLTKKSEGQEQPPESATAPTSDGKRSHFSRSSTKQKSSAPEKVCEAGAATSDQISSAEKSVNKANQRVRNLTALSQYSTIDMENVATQLYNDAKNQHLFGATAIAYIEKRLSDEYNIPMGTLTDSLTHAYQGHHQDTYVPQRIQSALNNQKNGNALQVAQQELHQAQSNLESLKKPVCVTTEAPTVSQPSINAPMNILELVNNSENRARDSGNEGNVFVQMRDLTIQLTGTDHGEQYEQTYAAYYQLYTQWAVTPGKKPTQYGFLTCVTDLMVNGAPTVPVEMPHQSWYQSAVEFVGRIGIGVQANGSSVHMGTMNNQELKQVYSSSRPQGVEGFQLLHDSQPNVSGATSSTSSLSAGEPTSAASSSVSSISPFVSVSPSAQVLQQSGTGVTANPNPVEPSVSNPVQIPVSNSGVSYGQTAVTSGGGSSTALPTTTINLVAPINLVAAGQEALKIIDTVRGLEGLGTYASGVVNKIAVTEGTLERIGNPTYQNEPVVQQIGCGVWGTVVEVAATAPLMLVEGPAAIVGAAVLGDVPQKVGDHAQQNCHDVVNMFK